VPACRVPIQIMEGNQVPHLVTNNGVQIPQLGFGTGQITGDAVVESLRMAVDAGYRLVDTATAYENESDVGRAIKECGVPRDELFVTTKLHRRDHGYSAALSAFDGCLERLGLEILDLYLIHFPLPLKDKYVETWRAFERIRAEGRVRAIGVSNFTVAHLTRLIEECDVVPAVNQVELHPGFPQSELAEFHRAHGILTEAWSPIGHGGGVLSDEVVVRIAGGHRRSPAQVVLRWQIQLGNIAIPRSTNQARIRSNIDVFGFELSQEDMDDLTGIGSDDRLGPDPAIFNPPDEWKPGGEWALPAAPAS
jgi:2,5-diketo-D-gluconate reductase A